MKRLALPKLVNKTFHHLSRDTHGAEIAEAAAVLPVMFMILLGIFWFGQAFNLYGAITRAAQEGARAGAAPVCSTCSAATNRPAQIAANAVQAALLASKLDPNLAQYPATPPNLNLCLSSGGSSGCDGTASTKVCVQTPVQLTSTGGTGAAGVCGISVSFKYPFQFKLPFTTLNNQQVLLNASARVRMETR